MKNMSTMKKTFWELPLVMTLLLASSCLKEVNNTIALPEIGTAANVIPEEIRDEFESQMNIYEGTNPPDITSSFVLSDFVLLYSSDGISSGGIYADQFMKFYNKIGNTYEYKGTQGGGEEYSPSVVVVGSGSKFTAYYVSTNNHYDGESWSEEANLISGIITDRGITDVTYAFIILDKYDPKGTIMEVNEYRIFDDRDGVAEFVNWDTTKSISAESDSSKQISKLSKSHK